MVEGNIKTFKRVDCCDAPFSEFPFAQRLIDCPLQLNDLDEQMNEFVSGQSAKRRRRGTRGRLTSHPCTRHVVIVTCNN